MSALDIRLEIIGIRRDITPRKNLHSIVIQPNIAPELQAALNEAKQGLQIVLDAAQKH